MKGTAWVDRSSYDLVRLEGITSASVSMWIGTPHIEIEFSQIDGLWLPVRTGAVSSGLLLGTSELEIRYCDYVIINPDHPAPSRAADVDTAVQAIELQSAWRFACNEHCFLTPKKEPGI